MRIAASLVLLGVLTGMTAVAASSPALADARPEAAATGAMLLAAAAVLRERARFSRTK